MNDLPPGYTVKADTAVGFSYYDDKGNIIFQHPVDSDSARTVVWRKYSQKPKDKKGK